MARNTRRRAARQKGEKALDFINSVAEDREDGGDSRATKFERHPDTESVDHEHGDEQRQLRRSTRNKRTAPGVERQFSPMFVAQDQPEGKAKDAAEKDINESEEADDLESEAGDAANAEFSEAEEAGEGEDDRLLEEDGDSVDSEDHESSDSEDENSMSDQKQLLLEQEQAIVNGQQGQQEQQEEEREQVLVNNPVSVVIDRSKERISKERKDAATAKPAEPEAARAEADHANFLGEDGEFEDSEPEQGDEDGAKSELEYEDDEEAPSDDNFDMDDTRHDAGNAIKSLFDWGDEQPAEPVQGSRINNQLETQPPGPTESTSRKRRASNTGTDEPNRTRRRIDLQNQNQVAAKKSIPLALPADLEATTSPEMPDRTRRRMETPNQGIERARRRRPPVARDSPEVADWEASVLEEETQDDVIIIGESMTYDDATKIQDLQATWERLIKYCQKLKDNDVRRMRRYVGIEAIVERISDLLKDYKIMQRKRFRGRPIDAGSWKRIRQEVKYISEDADKIRNVLVRRAKEGKDGNNLQTQADAVEYAELIVQHVMTSLCELALECLKTYYSVEDKWLLKGGFGAVLDIIDIVGELDLTLTSLHNCAMVMLSPYPGRPIRQELRSIRSSLARAEADEQRRGR